MKKSAIFVTVLFLIIFVSPLTAFACGICVDHGIDWALPFTLPFFPAAVLYLITRRVLYRKKRLPEAVPPPTRKNLILFIASAIALSIFMMGSVYIVMLLVVIGALQNFVRSLMREMRIRKQAKDSRPLSVFFKVFLVLWFISFLLAIAWRGSSGRMMYHMSYGGGAHETARAWYASHPAAKFRDEVRGEIEAALGDPDYQDYYLLSNMFFLAGEYNEAEIAPAIAKLLLAHITQYELYIDRFYAEGLNALARLNRPRLVTACIRLLKLKHLQCIRCEDMDYTDAKKLALILSALIEYGDAGDYADYITLENVKILKKYRTKRMQRKEGRRLTVEWDENIGLEGLDINLQAFGIDPAMLEDL